MGNLTGAESFIIPRGQNQESESIKRAPLVLVLNHSDGVNKYKKDDQIEFQQSKYTNRALQRNVVFCSFKYAYQYIKKTIKGDLLCFIEQFMVGLWAIQNVYYIFLRT